MNWTAKEYAALLAASREQQRRWMEPPELRALRERREQEQARVRAEHTAVAAIVAANADRLGLAPVRSGA